MTRHGGHVVVDQLAHNGVECIFQVPGESFLPVLDALYGRPDIRLVTGRQEGGVAMMAEAWGKLTGRPGVAFVTRGPGAANACAGLHVARQDDTPMLLCVGDVERAVRDREAFQEVPWHRTLAGFAKALFVVDDTARIPEYVDRAVHLARSGRPGPVVLVFPEDVLFAASDAPALPPPPHVQPLPDPAVVRHVAGRLAGARRPLLLLGGSDWTTGAKVAAEHFAQAWEVPVATAFRCQDHFDNLHPCYVGDLGIGAAPHLRRWVEESDLLLVVGTRIDEKTAGDYATILAPVPAQPLVHVHPDPAELGRVFRPELAVVAGSTAFLERLVECPPPAERPWAEDTRRLHEANRAWKTPEPEARRGVDLGLALAELGRLMAEDAIVASGAGNFSVWVHRFLHFRHYRSQLAPRSGSMGYALPAAVAAAVCHPEREVVAIAGDGDAQMTIQEFATAVQEDARLVLLVADNGSYGTIRMHQERHFPGRPSGSRLVNPDFAALARAMGGFGARVERTEDFADAYREARASGRPAILHLLCDPELLAPGRRLGAS
ncbi:Acetolactate synthase large subunit IlvB1 [bacterium HR39]|nr:Acetolactate synthase large subunit IlvB1 [bacterium HR39]